MKSEVLKKFEEMNQKRKISRDLRGKLVTIIFENLLIAISVMLLFISLMYTQRYCNKDMTITIYKFASLILLVTAIIVIERAYKKENGRQALQGIELLVIGIIVLFANYIIIRGSIFTRLIGVYIAIYYIIKTAVMYKNAKKAYLENNTDIKEIVKKESKDKIKKEKDIEKLATKAIKEDKIKEKKDVEEVANKKTVSDKVKSKKVKTMVQSENKTQSKKNKTPKEVLINEIKKETIPTNIQAKPIKTANKTTKTKKASNQPKEDKLEKTTKTVQKKPSTKISKTNIAVPKENKTEKISKARPVKTTTTKKTVTPKTSKTTTTKKTSKTAGAKTNTKSKITKENK